MNTPPVKTIDAVAVMPAVAATPLSLPTQINTGQPHDKKTAQHEAALKMQWRHHLRSAKKQWPKIDEQSISDVDGHANELIRLVREHYALSHEEAALQVRRFFDFSAATKHDDAFPGQWSNSVEAAHKRWSKISVHDLQQTGGLLPALVALISRRYGISTEEARHQTTLFLSRCVL